MKSKAVSEYAQYISLILLQKISFFHNKNKIKYFFKEFEYFFIQELNELKFDTSSFCKIKSLTLAFIPKNR